MFIYIILLILPLIFHIVFYNNNNINAKSKVFNFLMVMYTLVSAIRYNVGTDYLGTYWKVFYWLKSNLRYNYEFLFLELNKFVIRIGGTPILLLFICSVFTIPVFFRFIKKNVSDKYWFICVFLFIGLTIYYATMNVVRQYVAIAILLIAFEFLKKDKIIPYIALNIIAFMFHSSAVINIVFLILYLLYKNKKINNSLIFFYFFSLIFIFVDFRIFINLFKFIIPTRYISYLNSTFFLEKNYSAFLKIIFPNLITLFLITNRKKIKSEKNFNYVYIAMILYSIISNVGFGVNVFIRLGWYFDYYYLLAIPLIHNYSSKTFKGKTADLLLIVTIIYCLSWNVYSIFIQNGHGVIPYTTIWSYFNIG